MIFKERAVHIKNNNVLLNVRVYSENQKETIILLHGGPGIPDKMEGIVNVLGTKYNVISFDQRGTGNSICKKCDFSIKSYISDIDAIVSYFNIKKFHLFGYSWGGLYAQIYVNKNQEKIKSLFLCSSSTGTADIWLKSEKEIIIFNKKHSSYKKWLPLLFYSILGRFGNSNAYKKLFKLILTNYTKNNNKLQYDFSILNKISAKTINRTRRNVAKYARLKELENPKFKIFISYGENDIYVKSRKYILANYPSAKYQIIEKCGHTAWMQNPKKFEQILMKFYNL